MILEQMAEVAKVELAVVAEGFVGPEEAEPHWMFVIQERLEWMEKMKMVKVFVG